MLLRLLAIKPMELSSIIGPASTNHPPITRATCSYPGNTSAHTHNSLPCAMRDCALARDQWIFILVTFDTAAQSRPVTVTGLPHF